MEFKIKLLYVNHTQYTCPHWNYSLRAALHRVDPVGIKARTLRTVCALNKSSFTPGERLVCAKDVMGQFHISTSHQIVCDGHH